ncbi:sensor histidine kinase [Microbacterium hominis]|uniref:histidine kinase n=1 Tax=Microbacterium hominis TaxID=162426 RepID=A0A7D4U4I1_9MICO|nr:HAMP domain-containing sensor histidine kinase [Microbacterium hominis]QKJ19405.1 HAMP domain-containing histidine kinase [Microbacterium hominis]
MTLTDVLTVTAITLSISVAVGIACVGLLAILRQTRLYVQLIVALLAGVASVVTAMITVANLMYLSAHDLVVAIAVALSAGLSSALVAAALCVWVVRNSRALSRAAERIAQGEVVTASERSASAELARIESTLAETSAQLRESREREARIEASRRELVAWISHDLRTPLAGIRAMAEALEDGLADDPERYLRQMRGQVDLLTGMVEDLFDLSRLDAGAHRLAVQDVSLLDVVSDAVADLRPATRGRAVDVESGLDRDLVVRVDPGELTRAIGNLVMNAVQHTPAPGRIVVRAELVDDRPTVSVIDSGPGIDEADLPRLFEAGWRGSAARTPRTEAAGAPGAGLGLAIVRGIVDAHRGEVAVRNVPGGCRFDILLPAEAAQAT